MAIAGLPNVPILDPTIHVESLSSASGRRGNQRIRSTRASSILRMWRELEVERTRNSTRERGRSRVPQEGNDDLPSFREGEVSGGLEDSSDSENGSVVNFESHMGHVNEQEDHRSMTSGQSRDLGEVERERVRKIFQEWMINGGNAGTRHVAHINRGSRGQLFVENDRDRVRVVRDWVHMTSQQREVRAGSRGNQVAGIASQIEHFRNGQVFNHVEGQPEISPRQIRLCGRQALLDLLAKKEQERRDELQCLEGTRPVSGFAHRGRIQALLRLRPLQNRRRSTESRRPSSAAESELGLLRQRQTVSGLREGFMSRLDNNPHVQASDVSDGSSDNGSDTFRDDGSQANCASEVLDGAQDLNDPTVDVLTVPHEETSPLGAVDVTPSTALPSVDPAIRPSADLNNPTQHAGMVPASVVQFSNQTVGTGMDVVHKQHNRGALNLNPVAFSELESPPGNESNTEPCNTARNCSNEDTSSHQLGTHVEVRLECETNNIVESRPETATTTSVSSNGSSNNEFLEINAQESPRSGHEIPHEDFSIREEADVHNALVDQLDISENLHDHDLNVPELDWQGVSEFESVWEGSPFSDQWRDNQAETDGPRWPGEVEVQSHEALENEGVEQIDQDEYWDENNSLETGRDWLGLTSGTGLASDRVDTYYFSDDENVYHIELRELVNRRRVSSLLDSDFRENLDRLIQSYVDRQTDTPDDWEHHEILPHFVSRNQERLHTEQEESESYDPHANGNEPRLPPRPPPLPQAHWGRGLHQTNWARRNIHQQSGTVSGLSLTI
ncbi:hypothetical protein KSS87_022776 [Heliosperma pusillum]|nr:hypothetical protein KSS87_022776 [Heliosperma pusillum]